MSAPESIKALPEEEQLVGLASVFGQILGTGNPTDFIAILKLKARRRLHSVS